jgi:hypothetical protein
MPERLVSLNFQPGTQRDGTDLDGSRAIDARWTRWRNGRPRKIGGYKSIYLALLGEPRRIHMYYAGSRTYVHVGTSKSFEQLVLDRNMNVVEYHNRTPVGFTGGPNVGWTIDSIFDTTSDVGKVRIVAHATPDLDFLSDQIQTDPYIGDISSAAPLVPMDAPGGTDGIYTKPRTSGGIVVVQPYLMHFDEEGHVGWSAPNRPLTLGIVEGTTGAGQARVSSQKLVMGMPLRGGGANSPAALFWSLSEVIVAQWVGGDLTFRFSTVSPSSSILSSDSVIEYDGLYFWIGTDRFMVFNGTVSEVPNGQNQDWFFNNITERYACKTFAFKVPRYGEIWWCAPMFGNTEPSHAVIYNVRENVWYDTELPGSFRSCGYFAQGLRYPLLGSPKLLNTNGYGLWKHEFGFDAHRDGEDPTAIESYFETPMLGGPHMEPPIGNGTIIKIVEPDILQSGDIVVTLRGSANARDAVEDIDSAILKQNYAVPQEQGVGFKREARLARLRFSSNVLGGNFIFGKTVLHVDVGGDRWTGGASATKGGSPP